MNINASINSGLNLALRKKEKPTFQTVFDKLDARSKKMNYCNPVNSGMTNEQMFRFYLNETEPMLHKNDDTFDLSDIMDGDIKNMKLSDFAKLLSGNLGTDVGTKYESLSATVSEYGNPTVASILAPPPSTGTFAPAAPVIAPVAPVIAPPAAPVIAPAAPVIAPAAPPAAPSAPPAAPPATIPTPPTSPRSLAAAAAAALAAPATTPTPPVAAPTPPAGRAAAAAAARAAATAAAAAVATSPSVVATSPSAGAPPTPTPTPPVSPSAVATSPSAVATSPSAAAAAATLASISLTSTTPSSISVPIATVITRSTSSAAASLLALSKGSPAAAGSSPAAGSAPASSPARGATPITFPETPESKKIKPTQLQLAADYVNALGLDPTQPLDENTNNTISTFVGFNLNETFHSPSVKGGGRPASPTESELSANPTAMGTPESGYRNAVDVIAVKNGLAAGLNPPRVPKELPEARYNNPGWAKHFSDMLDYNETLEKDPATNKTSLKFRITDKMKLIIETYKSVSGDEKQFKIEIAKRKTEYDKLPDK